MSRNHKMNGTLFNLKLVIRTFQYFFKKQKSPFKFLNGLFCFFDIYNYLLDQFEGILKLLANPSAKSCNFSSLLSELCFM